MSVRRRAGALVLSISLTIGSWLLGATTALGQTQDTPSPSGELPAGTWLLVPLGIGLALFISYRLGREPTDADATRRREGPVSRALSARSRSPESGGPAT